MLYVEINLGKIEILQKQMNKTFEGIDKIFENMINYFFYCLLHSSFGDSVGFKYNWHIKYLFPIYLYFRFFVRNFTNVVIIELNFL